MLKKAGIAVAVATAGLLAVSPVAFAGGILSIDNNNVQVPIQACGNDIVAGAVGILSFDEIDNESSDEVECDQENSAENDIENED